jgi:hypothetical protein
LRESNYRVRVEFNVSDELFDAANQVAQDNNLSHQELAIASVGLLNTAHDLHFQTGKTTLIVADDHEIPIPSLVRPDGTLGLQIFRPAFKPVLYDPLEAYVRQYNITMAERVRRAIRFGIFVLQHVTPYEDEEVLFLHNKVVGIPFRTKQ